MGEVKGGGGASVMYGRERKKDVPEIKQFPRCTNQCHLFIAIATFTSHIKHLKKFLLRVQDFDNVDCIPMTMVGRRI